jgi:hypothetical protein
VGTASSVEECTVVALRNHVALASALLVVSAVRLSREVGATAAVLLIAAGLSHWRSFPEILRWDFRAEPRLSALTAARNELQEVMRDPRIVLVGCGAWVPRDLEYLLPASGNFKDCLLLRPEEMKGKRIIFVRNEFYNLERSEELDAFLQSCDRQTLFRRKPFVISECPALPK